MTPDASSSRYGSCSAGRLTPVPPCCSSPTIICPTTWSSRCSRCIASSATEEPEVIPELAEWVSESNVIPKNRYSGFFNTDLAERLASLNPDKIIVCGVCTDICVMHTTSDARNRDYAVEVPTDCVASFDADAHRWALDHIGRILGAQVV